ncbi:hypothetical protein EDB19DRAFT_1835364 [Suillus lakei]|nr:hypothetical protein EDB19DRAFT_1835364 [Suillus lakei]
MPSTPMITLGSEIYVWPRSSQKTSQICFICSSTGLSVYVIEFILGAQCGFTIGIQMVDVTSCEAFTWRTLWAAIDSPHITDGIVMPSESFFIQHSHPEARDLLHNNCVQRRPLHEAMLHHSRRMSLF